MATCGGALLVALFFPNGTTTAQTVVPRATPPRATLSRHDSATTTFEVGGIRVIHRMNPATEIAVANLYLLGGVRQVTAANAGIEPFLLEASERGTKTYPKDRLRKAMSKLGTAIVTEPAVDWTGLGIRATRTTFDSTWMIFASRIMQPTLDSTEVEILRNQFEGAVRQRRDSPDALIEFLADSFAFEGHPYAVPASGTEQSIASISVADLRKYHTEQFVKSRMLLVVVGNVPRTRVEALITQTLAKLPAGSYTWALPAALPRSRSAASITARALPTNYILGYYAGPQAGTKDYQAMRIASAILSGQLFGEIRSRRNLTYAVEAPFRERAVASGGLYVTTVNPELTMDVMRQQVAALREGYINPGALERLVSQFITDYFLDNETNAEQADFLARAALYQGDVKAAERFVSDLRSITPEDIRRVSREYMKNVRFAYIGDPARAPTKTMERF